MKSNLALPITMKGEIRAGKRKMKNQAKQQAQIL